MSHSSPHRSCPCGGQSPRQTPRSTAPLKVPGTRCSASGCGTCAPSRNDRSPGSRARSCALSHQVDKNVLQRALAGVQILDVDVELAQPPQQSRNARLAPVRIEGEYHGMSGIRQLERVLAESCRDGAERLLQVQNELALAQLAHEQGL